METGLLEKIINPYEHKARLFPVFMLIAPIVMLVVGMHGVALELNATLIGMFVTFGIFYLAASITRELGKRLENSLYAEWGGKPTTQLLRHSNPEIDPVTKARYHKFLSKHLGIDFPSKASEEGDSSGADDIYQSATKWLLDNTRDEKKFSLLFEENIAFGFRRNCLGIKPFGIVVSLSTLAWPLVTSGLVTIYGINSEALAGLSIGACVSLVVSFCMLLIWILFVTKATVKTAAYDYAHKLFSACDILPNKR